MFGCAALILEVWSNPELDHEQRRDRTTCTNRTDIQLSDFPLLNVTWGDFGCYIFT